MVSMSKVGHLAKSDRQLCRATKLSNFVACLTSALDDRHKTQHTMQAKDSVGVLRQV